MYITTIKGMLAGGVSLLILSGCAQNSPKAPVYDENGICTKLPSQKTYIDTNTGNTIIERHTIYTPDVNLKSAVVILTKKVTVLEKKVSRLQNRANTFKAQRLVYKGCGPAQPIGKKSKKYKDGTYRARHRVAIWSCATKRGKKTGSIEKSAAVKLVDCGIYGWCRIDGQDGYVQAYKLTRIGD